MNDLISRQAAIEALRTCYDTETKGFSDGAEWINYEDAVAMVENLPSAQSDRKKGKWRDRGLYALGYNCSCCGKTNIDQSDYCPNCGADMRNES